MVCPKTQNRRHSSSVKAISDLPKFPEKEIENFQQKLVQLGFLAKDSFKKGVFDDSTKKATQSFQKAFKTEKQDGTLDQKTLEIAEKAEKDKSIEPGIFGYPSFTSQDTISVDASTGFIPSCNTGITNNHVARGLKLRGNKTTLIKKDENGNFIAKDTPTIVLPVAKPDERLPDIAFSLPANKDKSNIAQCPWLPDEKISNILKNKEPIFIST
jgi:peptidoglycan hydrolase-like protein with peptidoglycan-binding domain